MGGGGGVVLICTFPSESAAIFLERPGRFSHRLGRLRPFCSIRGYLRPAGGSLGNAEEFRGKYSKTSNLLRSQNASLKSSSTVSVLHVLTVSPFVLLQVTTSCQTSTNHELVSVETRILVSNVFYSYLWCDFHEEWCRGCLEKHDVSDTTVDTYVTDVTVWSKS